MATFSQKSKFLQIESPLGPEAFVVQAFSGEEAINELYRFRVDAISPKEKISPTELLNQKVAICVAAPEAENKRWFHGIVASFSQTGSARRFLNVEDYWHYRLEVVPAMWRLTQRTECRIFQKQKTKEIVAKVLSENGITPKAMPGDPGREWETCVQYMESDFAFISRLMEEEGWLYFHKHSRSDHELHIVDQSTGYYPIIGGPNVYLGHREDQSHVLDTWDVEQRILPTQWETFDYSYLKVDQSTAKPNTVLSKPAGDLAVFDFPGGHMDTQDQEKRAKNRMEAIEAGGVVATGNGTCTFLAAGAYFTLKDHYSEDEEGKEWVCSRVNHIGREASELTGQNDPPMYSNSFTCAPRNTNLRPPRKTPRPVIAGTQTAIVSSANAQGDPDGHGRIKVTFHWVAKGRGRGAGESCWVRVAQPFAGPKFGFQYVPQVGDEVIVAFMDGDPDHPLVIGSVHNGKNKYPWDLPTNWTQSGFRTRAKGSGKWGEVSNVLRFEDKGGSEEVWINAAKDQLVQVAFNDKMQVGNNQDQEVTMDRSRKVGMNEKVKVGINQDITIGLNQHTKAGTKITLECGASKITMDPASIKIESVMITINGQAMLKTDAPMTMVNASGMLKLTGGIIFIN